MIAAQPAAPVRPPARVQVVAREFSYGLSRGAVPAGPVIVELVNAGQDAHDLRLRRVGGTHVFAWPTAQPGTHVDREIRLAPGRYVLWCAIADHRERGMHAVLVVRRVPKKKR